MPYNRKPKAINPDEVDPSVYYYDEVYDDIQEQRSSHDRPSDAKRQKQGSKYIQGIIETADRRRSEKEIRKFKKYARDREEAEADGHIDKTDVYVSKSYEKKLKEMREVLEKHSKQDQETELNSFKRHKNLPQAVGETSSSDPVPRAESQDLHIVKRKKPKTLDERREYLRNVLKKQTVGNAFDAAVERYRQRCKHVTTTSAG